MDFHIPRCQHVKADGMGCGSPALQGERFCYFHLACRARDLRRNRTKKPVTIPPLEDANAVQLGLMNVLDAIAHNRIDNKQAALLLYGLQTAAINLKRVNFEPRRLREWAYECARADQARAEQARAEHAEQAHAEQAAENADSEQSPITIRKSPMSETDLAAAEALFRASGK